MKSQEIYNCKRLITNYSNSPTHYCLALDVEDITVHREVTKLVGLPSLYLGANNYINGDLYTLFSIKPVEGDLYEVFSYCLTERAVNTRPFKP